MTRIAAAVFIILQLACSGSKKNTHMAIGFINLHNYALRPSVSFAGATNYVFIGNASRFYQLFYMTKVAGGTAIIPDFTTQSVVAIILKPSERVISAEITKAEIAGIDLNIYYTITDTTSWKNYVHTPVVVATVPRSAGVRQVNFYTNGKKETIPAIY